LSRLEAFADAKTLYETATILFSLLCVLLNAYSIAFFIECVSVRDHFADFGVDGIDK
jgi:hypothetical protein